MIDMAAKRILAIENNDLVLSFLEAGLANAGYHVDTAHNGLEALEKIDRGGYDVIISDVRMPGMDGLGLCRALADRHSDALNRFIFLTTPDSMESNRAFLAGTGMPALTKPIALEDLRVTIARMVSSTP